MFDPLFALYQLLELKRSDILVSINADKESLIFQGWPYGNICYHKYDFGKFEIFIEGLEYIKRFDTLSEAVQFMDCFSLSST